MKLGTLERYYGLRIYDSSSRERIRRNAWYSDAQFVEVNGFDRIDEAHRGCSAFIAPTEDLIVISDQSGTTLYQLSDYRLGIIGTDCDAEIPLIEATARATVGKANHGGE